MTLELLHAGFLGILATILALLEIEIEGQAGWAERLPTFTLRHKLLGKKVTGYHILMISLLVTLMHYPYVSGVTWTWQKELITLSDYFLLAVFWDFFWFILNPYYGLKNFKREKIWWHAQSRWLFGWPLDYYSGILIALGLSYAASGMNSFMFNLEACLIMTGLLAVLESTYHKLYWKLHQN